MLPTDPALTLLAATSQQGASSSARSLCLSAAAQQGLESLPVTTDKIQQVQTCKLFIKFSHFICTEKNAHYVQNLSNILK